MIIHSHTKNQVNISNHSEIKWWQLNIWPNFKVVVTTFFAMLGDIDLMFGIWVYNDELHIKFTFRSGPMIFGRVMALALWNLAKYLVVTILFHYEPERISQLICNLWLYTHKNKNQVNISNHSEIKWWQLNIWPNFIVQGP
jgi:hypothetical protein